MALLVCSAYAAQIASGPLLGDSSMSEVKIWIQTDSVAECVVSYWEVDNPAELFRTHPLVSSKRENFIVHCVADKVRSGTEYGYAVELDGKEIPIVFPEGYAEQGRIPLRFKTPEKWRHRLDNNGTPPEFRVAAGSCANIVQEGYGWEEPKYLGGDYRIFESIYEKRPDLMIWLGDNIYLGEEDWTSRTGFFRRYDHFRKQPYLRALNATAHHYAIWDDHDYGPNNSGESFGIRTSLWRCLSSIG
ncbi:MAG: hypothetical protein AAGB46_08325 [Verrucomicrobiota bacterium]